MSRIDSALDWLWIRGLLPPDIAAKTPGYYRRVLRRIVRALYQGAMTQDEALDRLMPLIEGQIMRGMRQGLREVGRNPDDIYLDSALAGAYDDILRNEYDHLLSLLDDVTRAAADDSGLAGVYQRLEMWVNRYDDARNRAMVLGAPNTVLLIWTYGDTEHCDTCAALNGRVASAETWRASGYRPQSPPNAHLDCGGWRCQCTLTVAPKDAEPNWDGTL